LKELIRTAKLGLIRSLERHKGGYRRNAYPTSADRRRQGGRLPSLSHPV